jgi:hypothetical protein
MSSDYLQYALRNPRYSSAAPKVRVEVEQTVDGLTGLVQAELQNLSRHGYHVKTPVSLNAQQRVNLHLRIEDSTIDLTLPGTVQWQRPAGDGTWLAGCQADYAIDWEMLGELFLSGVLSTDRP